MQDSTETLARSQLETLYRLGIIERNSEEERDQSSENGSSRVNKRHEAFLAALPPPSAVFPLPSRIFQSSVDDFDSSQHSSSSKSSDIYESSGVSSRLLELSRRRQRYKPRRSTSLHSSGSSAESSSSQLRRDRRALRMLFRQWKSFVRYRREKARRLGAADTFLKQSVFTKWAAFLKQRRYEHETMSLVDSWKLSRAISRWIEWKKRCCMLRGLLSRGRSSFMGRLIQQRIWRRWIRFAKRRKYVHDLLEQRILYLQHRLVHRAWIELRIQAFRARQGYLLLRKYYMIMRELLTTHERQHVMCVRHLQKVNLGRRRKVFHRWRAFTDAYSRDRRLAWHVQFVVRRRRYFLLWCEVARTFNHVEQLRSKVMLRELYQHFSMWKTTTRAIQIGDRARGNYEKRIRAIYFRALKDQTSFSVHCSHVKLTLNHRRLAVAVNRLHVWATERRRRRDGIRRIQEMWQTRLLRQIWMTCWLGVHRMKMADKHSWTALQLRYFDNWKLFIRTRQAYHLQEEQAEVLHGKFCCKRALEGWKEYYKLRLKRAQELARAQEHYLVHLLHRGVMILWGAVYQNAQNSLRSHQLRQNMRISLKKRHFHIWRFLMLSRKKLADQLQGLQQSLDYHKSDFNPRRRIWNRWIMFVSLCRQRHRGDRHFRLRIKRKVLFEWHRQAKLESSLRVFEFHRCRRDVGDLFARWKSRVEKWKKVGVICELAEQVYERKLCTRVIRDWRCSSTYLRRVRQCGESIRHQREMKLQTMWLLEWREKFVVYQCVSRLRRSREHRLLRTCFTSWFRHSITQKALSRKLTHFQQVYGKYPASSIVSRAWHHWKCTCNKTRCIKTLCKKLHLRQARQCWLHWKFFHTACCTLRVWHQAARAMSSSNSQLGMRLRCFRVSRRLRLQKYVINEWKCLIERSRNLQERQSLWKYRLSRELEGVKCKSEQAIRHYLRSWFRRWCIAHKNDSNFARVHFQNRLLSNVVLSWWRTTVHSKQEKVLVEAQQAMGKLSYYHPQQHVYLAHARQTDKQKKKKSPKRKVKITSKDVVMDRTESMRRMRRMLDPTEYASYSRFYQENGRNNSPNKPYNGVTKSLPAKIVVNHPVSDIEPPRRLYNDQSPRVGKLRRAGHENCDHDDPNGGGIELKQSSQSAVSNCTSHCDTTRVSNQAVIQHHPEALASNNQVSFKPQSQDYLHLPHSPILSEVSVKPRPSSTKVPENVLPLFDDELPSTRVAKPIDIVHHFESVITTEKRVRFAPDLQREKTVNTFDHSPDVLQNDTFILSANRSKQAHLRHREDSQTLTTKSHEHDEIRTARDTPPTMIDSSLSLNPTSDSNSADQQRKSQVIKRRKPMHKKQIKVVNSSNNETRPLSDILNLSDGVDSNPSENNEAHTATEWNNDSVWDESVLKEITSFYANSVMAQAARDLALLQNDFYIDELENVYEATVKDYVVDADKHEEQLRFERFLEKLVESHPRYRKYVNLSLRRSYTTPLSPLNWLGQHHLRLHLALQKKARVCPKKSKAYWIWEPMAADMVAALDKLLPAITKYMRVLGQFFLRQAVQTSSTRDKPKDYRLSSTAFISLMKQVRVFPQLFHRRELENAVRLSCCSSPETEELNFPEFIEALVRCSCNLRWGELDGDKTASADTVIVIKFVMLIFAMEGQGSVLKKRNEDVSAILGFLGQQQKKKQAEKLFRFRKVLADTCYRSNKRRTRASRSHQLPSGWNQVRLQFSSMNSPTRSPTRSQDSFDELTQSWDGDYPRRVSTEPLVFDAQTNQPFDLDIYQPPKDFAKDPQPHDQPQPSSMEFGKNEHDQNYLSSNSVEITNYSSPFSRETPPPTAEKMITTYGDVDYHSSTVTESALRDESFEPKKVNTSQENTEQLTSKEDLERVGSALNCEQEHQKAIPFQPANMVEPMEKDEFLREIMDSIGDVELMLNQPRFAGSNYSKHGKRQPRRIFSSTSVDATHHAVHANSTGSVPSLSDLAGDSLLHDQHDNTFSNSADVERDVRIRDPMLNYLTDIERFTESTASDTTSLVAIADMAGLPFTQDTASQDHQPEPDTWASQEIRPTEEVEINASSQASTHESDMDENTIK